MRLTIRLNIHHEATMNCGISIKTHSSNRVSSCIFNRRMLSLLISLWHDSPNNILPGGIIPKHLHKWLPTSRPEMNNTICEAYYDHLWSVPFWKRWLVLTLVDLESLTSRDGNGPTAYLDNFIMDPHPFCPGNHGWKIPDGFSMRTPWLEGIFIYL